MLKPLKNSRLEELKWKAIGRAGKLFVDLLFATTRIDSVGFEAVRSIVDSRRMIVAFWHSRILLVSYLYQGLNAVIMVSPSQDGEIIARIIENQGHEAVRGSSSKGGLRALATMVKRLREKVRPAGIIPDGPQGPRFKVQPGVIALARKTGYPIVPMSYSARKIKTFASWDRFILPYPFTRCRIVYGNPVVVPHNADRNAEEGCRLQLETELCRITAAADRHFGHRES